MACKSPFRVRCTGSTRATVCRWKTGKPRRKCRGIRRLPSRRDRRRKADLPRGRPPQPQCLTLAHGSHCARRRERRPIVQQPKSRAPSSASQTLASWIVVANATPGRTQSRMERNLSNQRTARSARTTRVSDRAPAERVYSEYPIVEAYCTGFRPRSRGTRLFRNAPSDAIAELFQTAFPRNASIQRVAAASCQVWASGTAFHSKSPAPAKKT